MDEKKKKVDEEKRIFKEKKEEELRIKRELKEK